MNFTPTRIPEVVIIEPDLHEDERGFFYVSFNGEEFNKNIGVEIDFVQDNHSYSTKNILRGLH